MGENCAIVINGKIDRKRSDLKPHDKLIFSYDDSHGVNVVKRIVPAGTAQQSETTATHN